MKRKIIIIDEDLCDACGDCVVACAEGAIEIIEGKAKLVKEQYCDGFGDCLGECPTGALRIEEVEADAFDADATKQYLLASKGPQAVERMEKAAARHATQTTTPTAQPKAGGCPGARAAQFEAAAPDAASQVPSQLTHWPIQMSLISPEAPVLKNADLLLAADCTAFAYGDFHRKFLAGRAIIIGCPKLDETEPYLQKLTAIIKNNDLKSLTVAHMEVPCCHGLAHLAKEALNLAASDLELQTVILAVSQ